MRVILTTPNDATRITTARTVAAATAVTARRPQAAPTPSVPAATSGFGPLPAPIQPRPVAAALARARNLVQVQQWAQDAAQPDVTANRYAVRAYPSLPAAMQIIAPGMPAVLPVSTRRVDLSA